MSTQRGQAAVLLLGGLLAVCLGAAILAAVAHGIGAGGERQKAADLAALAASRAMRADYSRLFEPVTLGGRLNPRHLDKAMYLSRGRAAAARVARLNGAQRVRTTFPDGRTIAPVEVKVVVSDPIHVNVEGHHDVAHMAMAEAELAPPGGGPGAPAGAGEYHGPLAYRQGKPMRPDVARAFDRMAAAASRDGISLIVNSAFRTNAEQAALFAAHPDPKWVAPPGKSLHRLATELDLGPPSAYAWLHTHAGTFHFVQRYSWEPWHYGYALDAGTTSVGFGGDGSSGRTLPSFVPARYAPMLAHAASRWNVSAALLAAQLYAESGFNPFATSGAGAQGIAQFMPGTAAALGLNNPFDAPAAIDAQAHLMRDLLGQFGSVPLALAAYNAGPAPVRACGCVPDNGETPGYVARILGLLGGAGDPTGAGGLEVRLVA
ncbi:MAG TPA: transglycosylase SLT domain-containing protein [Solirubrobacteraceae bacterium]